MKVKSPRSPMWKVPRMWDGETVAILASGPTMNRGVVAAVERAKLRSIVINTTYRIAPQADILYAADKAWWEFYYKQLNGFAGIKATCSPDPITLLPFPDVMMLRMTGKAGFDPDPGCIRSGQNSGYQAIHIAVHAGAKRILLFGFDMHGGHWHGRHPPNLRNAGEDIFLKWIPFFDRLAVILHDMEVEVLNCTPGSALKCFPSTTLEAVVPVLEAV